MWVACGWHPPLHVLRVLSAWGGGGGGGGTVGFESVAVLEGFCWGGVGGGGGRAILVQDNS